MEYEVTPPADDKGQKLFVGAYAYKETLLEELTYFKITGDEIIGDGVSDTLPAYIPIVRDLPDTGYEAEQEVNVSLAYDIDEASPPIKLVINESIPKDWTLVSTNLTPSATTSRSIEWTVHGNPVVDGNIQYTLLPPVGEYEPKLFTGFYAATSGIAQIKGPIIGDDTLSCAGCECPIFYDIEGPIPLRIDHYELLILFKQMREGTADYLDLFCFQRQWMDFVTAPEPTATPTATPVGKPE
jgi:hypothetical protein